MATDEIPPSENLLLVMHNLGLVRPETAKTGDELAEFLRMDTKNVYEILDRQETYGFVRSYIDPGGVRKYYLTGVGIIKVCSSFT